VGEKASEKARQQTGRLGTFSVQNEPGDLEAHAADQEASQEGGLAGGVRITRGGGVHQLPEAIYPFALSFEGSLIFTEIGIDGQ
jgi:hypothetical protein